MKPAKIVTFHEFEKLRSSLGKIVCTSGPFDPIHPGHLSCIHESKKYGDTLVVIVNGDTMLKNKKGKVEITYSAYSINKGIDDKIFTEVK